MNTVILLLANVFENFQDTCLDAYKLDPAHYVSAPGLTWDALLKANSSYCPDYDASLSTSYLITTM